RGFNRFYTNAIGALREGLLDSPYSLTEARLIFELAQVERMDVVDLRRSLDIDAGYLSRILARFERAGLVTRERSERDARRQVIRLARRGRSAFKMLDSRSAKETGALLGRHDPDEQRRAVAQWGLRLVEPTARVSGIGAALVNECVGFARRAGYERMMLWTNDALVDARRIYERAGFVLAEEHGHRAFGHDLVSQDWWLTL